MHIFARSVEQRVIRRTLRRVVGLVLLALFARQTPALGWTVCNDGGTLRSPAPMSDMAGMDHERRDGADGADGRDGRMPAQVPSHSSGCDHSIPAGDCPFGIGCVIAVTGTPIVVTDASPTPGEAVRLPEPSRPLAPEFSPDPPPPRA